MGLDKIDKSILDYLQNDSKITTKELSLHMNLSSTAIYERVKKLEKSGIIKKYIAIVDMQKINKSFVVFCQIKLTRHSQEYVNKFERHIVKFDEVLECFNVGGEHDYILKVVVEDMQSYRDFLNNKLTTLDHISSTHSTFIMNEVKNTFSLSL